MLNISVAEILKIKGKWLEASEYASLIAGKLKLTERQAYNRIKKACGRNEIKRVMLPDRSVLYGLAEFGAPSGEKQIPETLNFEQGFRFRCFRNLERISDLNVEKNNLQAYQYLKHLKAMLPQPVKDKLNPYFKEADKVINNTKGLDFYTTLLARQRVADNVVQSLIDKISTLLHEL